jgi:hypothetical protein
VNRLIKSGGPDAQRRKCASADHWHTGCGTQLIVDRPRLNTNPFALVVGALLFFHARSSCPRCPSCWVLVKLTPVYGAFWQTIRIGCNDACDCFFAEQVHIRVGGTWQFDYPNAIDIGKVIEVPAEGGDYGSK